MVDLPPSPFFDKAPSLYRITPRTISQTEQTAWSSRLVEPRGGCAAACPPPCLDYRSQSETPPSGRPKWSTFPTASGAEWNLDTPAVVPPGVPPLAKMANRVRVFPSGELEVRSVSRGSSSKPPPRAFGKRWSSGVSGNGRRVIRRAVNALVAREPCQVALYTLSSQSLMSDDEWNKRLHAFLAWGRKYLPHIFKHYVCVNQLQARGTLHAHLLLFKRVPKGLWRRMRDLWAVKYEMGPGSFDVVKIRSAARAAAYMTRYLTKGKDSAYRLGLDGGGTITFEPWAVGRNGEPYQRMKFRGNAYRVSDALRLLARPIAEYHLPWGSPLALKLSCNLRGGVQFFPSSAAALAWITSNLAPGVSARCAPGRVPAGAPGAFPPSQNTVSSLNATF